LKAEPKARAKNKNKCVVNWFYKLTHQFNYPLTCQRRL